MDIQTLSIADAADLLHKHPNTIRYRIISKEAYKHSKMVTPTGEVYMIDAADFYAKHPEVAPEGWSQSLEGATTFVGASDAIEGGDAARALEPLQDGATAVLALTPALLRALMLKAVHEAIQPLQEAARVAHEDNQMLQQQMTQLQQQQAVIYHAMRQQRGRRVLRAIGRFVGL